MSEIRSIIDQALRHKVFGENFKFRKNQLETIEAVCEAYLENPKGTVIIDAPTGTGKSLIAMWCSYIFSQMDKTGYLITSDLSLQDQYEQDLEQYGIRWPSVKGVDNYQCDVNNLPFSIADCKLRGLSYEQAEKLDCFKTCGYLQNRKRAIESRVSVFNYSYWLLQRNYVVWALQGLGVEEPFTERDFTFFDEAHKIDEIVQGHFTPRVDQRFTDKIIYINRFLEENNIEAPMSPKGYVQGLIQNLMTSTSKPDLFATIQEFRGVASVYRNTRDEFMKTVKKRFKGEIPSDWTNVAQAFDYIKDVYCKFDDYTEIIKDHGINSMVIEQGSGEAKFMCIEEADMIKKYLHEKAGFKVFMSATIGNPRMYAKAMGITDAKYIKVGNEFNFDKSPIVFVNRHKLTYATKEDNLPKVNQILNKILEKHAGQRGIIHSGSYEFTQYIMDHCKNDFRLLDYQGSKEKKETLKQFLEEKDSVLVGPSILEGLDLKDDISRFQVFFKVPYPNLGDPLIKAKMENSREWYSWKTGVRIMQGVGRSVRSKDDWAVTYIIDASFGNLLRDKEIFPNEFKERLKTIY